MVSITESGIEQTLLIVKTRKNHKEEHTGIEWEYPDRPNAYFLIGVLESIKLELLDHINEESEDKLGGNNENS